MRAKMPSRTCASAALPPPRRRHLAECGTAAEDVSGGGQVVLPRPRCATAGVTSDRDQAAGKSRRRRRLAAAAPPLELKRTAAGASRRLRRLAAS